MKNQVKIEVQNFSTHWAIRAVRDGVVIRCHTGGIKNQSYKRKILKNIRQMYLTNSAGVV